MKTYRSYDRSKFVGKSTYWLTMILLFAIGLVGGYATVNMLEEFMRWLNRF